MSDLHNVKNRRQNSSFIIETISEEVYSKRSDKIRADINVSQVIELFSPIVSVSKVLGTWPKDSDKLRERLSAWNGVSLFICHLYSVQILIEFILESKQNISVFTLFIQMTAFLRTLAVILIIDIRFVKHQKIMKLFRELSAFPSFNDDYNPKHLSNTFRHIMYGFLVFVLIQTVVSTDAMFKQTNDTYVNIIFHKLIPNSKISILDIILMAFKWFSYLFFVISNECLTKIYFLCICLILRNKIRDFNLYFEHLEQKTIICSTEQIQQIYRLHSELTSIVEGIERHFSFQSFLWVFSLVMNVCVKIQVIITGIKSNDYRLFAFILTDLFYFVLIFVAILLTSSEISEEKSGPVLSVTKIAENADICDLNLQQQIQVLITKLNTPMMKLTGWNCFELNKAFMLTVMGALGTYTIVVVQMS